MLTPRKPTARRFKTAVIGVVLSLPVVSCSRQTATNGVAPARAAQSASGGLVAGGGPGRGGGTATVPVVTAKVQRRAVPITIPAVGIVEALSSIQIRAQTTGQLSAVHFSEGEYVNRGQLLFALDPRPFQAALSQAEAVLARDTATANNTERQKLRYEELFTRGLIARDQYEAQRATSDSSQATLELDRASVETAKLNLAYTRITAPISGRTGALGAHAGELVRANDTAPLVIINQVSPIYVSFSVPGRYLSDIRRYRAQKGLLVQAKGQTPIAPGAQAPPPRALTPALGQEAAPGRGTMGGAKEGLVEMGVVTFVDNTVDALTGTIKLKATFDNAEALWPGLFVQVTLQLATEEGAIVVPATAVQPSADGHYVYVVKLDRTVEVRPVTLERQFGEEMVVATGLSDGEEVVIDGQLRLTPGARVSTGYSRERPAGDARQGAKDDQRPGTGRKNSP